MSESFKNQVLFMVEHDIPQALEWSLEPVLVEYRDSIGEYEAICEVLDCQQFESGVWVAEVSFVSDGKDWDGYDDSRFSSVSIRRVELEEWLSYIRGELIFPDPPEGE